MTKVGINGLGRIGRCTLKVLLEVPELEIVAVNDLVPAENLAYLLQYDTVYGRYGKRVEAQEGKLLIDGKTIPVLNEKAPENLPWGKMGIETVFECTGVFRKEEDLKRHFQAGAKHVILSAPSKSDTVPTVVHGVNGPDGEAETVSCASCTTNCITPVMEVLRRRLGVEKAMMTTIHAYTSTQGIVDGPSKKVRRGRAAAANFVPTTTGAAVATTKALPDLEGKFDGVAVRGPVPVGSIADIVCLAKRNTSPEELRQIFREEAESDRYQGVLGVSDDPIVSSDVIGDARASIVDLEMIQVVDGNLVKLMSWYDNEWGYASQMVRHAVAAARQPAGAA
jgi:glyceraldehyde 3-phosphate dehydrogenase